MTVLWLESGYTMKYCLSPQEIPRAPPLGFHSGSGNISSYTPPLVTIQLQYQPGHGEADTRPRSDQIQVLPVLRIHLYNNVRYKKWIVDWHYISFISLITSHARQPCCTPVINWLIFLSLLHNQVYYFKPMTVTLKLYQAPVTEGGQEVKLTILV